MQRLSPADQERFKAALAGPDTHPTKGDIARETTKTAADAIAGAATNFIPDTTNGFLQLAEGATFQKQGSFGSVPQLYSYRNEVAEEASSAPRAVIGTGLAIAALPGKTGAPLWSGIAADGASDLTGTPRDWKLTLSVKGETTPLFSATKEKIGIKQPNQLTKDPIGHASVIIEGPDGQRVAAGKWPLSVTGAEDWVKGGGGDGFWGPFDMRGAIKSSAGEEAFLRENANKSRYKTYDLTSDQANAVQSFFQEQKQLQADKTLRYKLLSSQCATFACDAVRQAGQEPPYAGFGVARPRVLYNSIGKELGLPGAYSWADIGPSVLPYSAGVGVQNEK